MSNVLNLMSDLRELANPVQAKNLQRFFKTGKGEYGEGDLFLGLKVPQVRQIVRKYWEETSLEQAEKLLRSKHHEVRQCALFIMVERFNKVESERDQIYRIYITNTKYINNWDLVDLTAPQIVGAYLYEKPKDLLYKFAKSNNLWKKRIAILATFYYIYKGESQETIKIAKILLHPSTKLSFESELDSSSLRVEDRAGDHDLIHKAVGWMLREVGKRCSQKTLTDFLNQYSHKMPRTMLRYSIEKLSEKKRKYYLRK